MFWFGLNISSSMKITTIVQTSLADMITKYNTSEEINQAVNQLQKDVSNLNYRLFT